MRRRAFIAGLGGSVTMLRGARAQQTLPVIGFLSGAPRVAVAGWTTIFQQTLGQGGYIEDQTVKIEYRWAEGRFDRLPELAADLVRRRVNVIVAVGGDQSVLAAKTATSTIPIVFTLGSDPVKLGLVASLNRPGGNMTGITQFTTSLEPKRFELLREAVPNAGLIAILINPDRPVFETQVKALEAAAQAVGQRVLIVRASNDRELVDSFASMAEQRVGALLVASDAYFSTQRAQLVALAARHSLPTIFTWREFVTLGGLMSYGTSLSNAYQQVAAYTIRVLKGENPADLPVHQTVKVELVLNLKTAKALGLTFPISLLGRADEVIE